MEQWPQISADLLILPDVMHRFLRRVVEEPSVQVREVNDEAKPSWTRSFRSIYGPDAASAGNPARKINLTRCLGLLLAVGGGSWLIAAVIPGWPGWLALGVGLGLVAGAANR